MIYALILTTFMFGEHSSRSVAVAQSTTIGFTTHQACVNAGEISKAGAIETGTSTKVVIIYQCAPLSV